MSKNLLPPPPYHIEPAQDDDSELSILSGTGDDAEQIAVVYGYLDIPGSARAMAELFVRALEQQP